ncbi:MAG: hypothetical protein SGI99_14870 [Pseudomonadota bacterium]|nr:hypothetical protein [Pseudomonadota bacterium]
MKRLFTEQECDAAIKGAQVAVSMVTQLRDFLAELPQLTDYEPKFKGTNVVYPDLESEDFAWALPIIFVVHARRYALATRHVWELATQTRILATEVSIVPVDPAEEAVPLVSFVFTPDGRGRFIGDASRETSQIRRSAFKTRFVGLMIANAQQRIAELRD